ncbi:hypothetical protein ACLK1S_19030 [Escherichia coli]
MDDDEDEDEEDGDDDSADDDDSVDPELAREKFAELRAEYVSRVRHQRRKVAVTPLLRKRS